MDEHIDFRESATFYDDINYPRGFGKHGDFTIREAETLHAYGKTLADLSAGLLDPQSDDEKHFVKVSNGETEPSTYIERLWLKYKEKIRSKQLFFGLSTPVHRVSGAPDTDFDPL